MDKKRKRNGLVWASTLTAALACYGTLALVAILAALGVSITVNAAAMSGVISVLALSAVILFLFNARRNGSYGPSVLALAGAGLILWAMWGQYHWFTEFTGFALMISGAYWERRCLA